MDTSNGLEPYQKDKGFKQLIKYFLQGLFYLMPIAITIYIVVQSILLIDNLIIIVSC